MCLCISDSNSIASAICDRSVSAFRRFRNMHFVIPVALLACSLRGAFCAAMPPLLSAASMDWKLPPEGTADRRWVIERLFMTVAERESFCLEEQKKCLANPLSKGIRWDFMNDDWVLPEVYERLDLTATNPDFDLVYV